MTGCFEMGSSSWKDSHVTFKTGSTLLIILLSAPCNFVTLYYTWNPLSEISNQTMLVQPPTKDPGEEAKLPNETFECFENLTRSQEILDNSKYWIEGVCILIVAVTGIFGKLLLCHPK